MKTFADFYKKLDILSNEIEKKATRCKKDDNDKDYVFIWAAMHERRDIMLSLYSPSYGFVLCFDILQDWSNTKTVKLRLDIVKQMFGHNKIVDLMKNKDSNKNITIYKISDTSKMFAETNYWNDEPKIKSEMRSCEDFVEKYDYHVLYTLTGVNHILKYIIRGESIDNIENLLNFTLPDKHLFIKATLQDYIEKILKVPAYEKLEAGI